MKVKLLLLFTLLSSIAFIAQKKETTIVGKVRDSDDVIKNVHVVNITKKTGIFTTEQGNYFIKASLGDTLQYTSVQHKTKLIPVSEQILSDKRLDILLEKVTINLDSFDLKRNDLSGKLDVDLNQLPKNVKDSLVNEAVNFSKVKFYEVDTKIDDTRRTKADAPIVDPNQRFQGVNILSFFSFKKRNQKGLKPVEKVSFKRLTSMIIEDLGDDFFTESLKIPKEYHFDFVKYCKPKGIEELYTRGKKLDAIQILVNESKSFLKKLEKK